ncbi:hypothetical protein JOB18_036283 [Solea senegalensis]|uniref:Uncharacterized protein n=1 Tax=Solea senegalensis TaxID=28829 RepID=A0AAV6QDI4_SOLSE|nr:serine/threonine-protein kinase DCLK2-like [Solea senegalensis]KAG7486690.1 hypothetical protein JOB18_036283 [Solea senegalensis]
MENNMQMEVTGKLKAHFNTAPKHNNTTAGVSVIMNTALDKENLQLTTRHCAGSTSPAHKEEPSSLPIKPASPTKSGPDSPTKQASDTRAPKPAELAPPPPPPAETTEPVEPEDDLLCSPPVSSPVNPVAAFHAPPPSLFPSPPSTPPRSTTPPCPAEPPRPSMLSAAERTQEV